MSPEQLFAVSDDGRDVILVVSLGFCLWVASCFLCAMWSHHRQQKKPSTLTESAMMKGGINPPEDGPPPKLPTPGGSGGRKFPKGTASSFGRKLKPNGKTINPADHSDLRAIIDDVLRITKERGSK